MKNDGHEKENDIYSKSAKASVPKQLPTVDKKQISTQTEPEKPPIQPVITPEPCKNCPTLESEIVNLKAEKAKLEEQITKLTKKDKKERKA